MQYVKYDLLSRVFNYTCIRLFTTM